VKFGFEEFSRFAVKPVLPLFSGNLSAQLDSIIVGVERVANVRVGRTYEVSLLTASTPA